MNLTATQQQPSTPPKVEEIKFAVSPFTEETVTLFHIVFRVLLTGGLCSFGLGANIVNLLVFYRQGPMSSSPTVILTGLAVSDLFICLFGLSSAGFATVSSFFDYSDWDWFVPNFWLTFSARPLNMLTQMTCWVTTFMGFERAISVVFPFKVKAIFTPRRSLTVLVVIFVLLFAISLPNFMQHKLDWYHRDNLGFNRSQWDFVTNEKIPLYAHMFYFIASPLFLRFSSVLIVVFCNVIIFWKVQSSQRFRKSKSAMTATATVTTAAADVKATPHHTDAAAAAKVSKKNAAGDSSTTLPTTTEHSGKQKRKQQQQNQSNKDLKDMKLLRMITVVSGLFMACYSMTVPHVIVVYLVLEPYVDVDFTVDNLIYDISMVLQCVNSSFNIIIYFHMSARYKQELLELCNCCAGADKHNKNSN